MCIYIIIFLSLSLYIYIFIYVFIYLFLVYIYFYLHTNTEVHFIPYTFALQPGCHAEEGGRNPESENRLRGGGEAALGGAQGPGFRVSGGLRA